MKYTLYSKLQFLSIFSIDSSVFPENYKISWKHVKRMKPDETRNKVFCE